jgi:UDP-2,3-diacylglucosamine pyrophosphatase LpxH
MSSILAGRALPDVAEILTIDLPPQATVLFAADLHLRGEPSPAVAHLIQAVATLPRRSVVVLGGDVLELLDVPDHVEPDELLAANQALVAALRDAAGRGVRVVWLVGNHDIRLARDGAARAGVAARVCCEFALAADVGLPTGAGTQRVWFEHGNRDDPYNRFTAPEDPNDTPFGEHLVREVLPALRSVAGAWVDDAAALTTPASFPAFVTSRMFYRRVLRAWPWALAILGGLFLLRLAGTALLGEVTTSAALLRNLANQAALALLDGVLLAVAAVTWARRTATRVATAPGLFGERQLNRALAAALRDRHPEHVGLVTGHTHVPQLSDIDGGFYANPGGSCAVVRSVAAWGWAPPVFRRTHDVGWVQIGGGPKGVHAELHHGALPDPAGQTWVERWLARGQRQPSAPAWIAAWPEGPTTVQVPARRPVRAIRRAAA